VVILVAAEAVADVVAGLGVVRAVVAVNQAAVLEPLLAGEVAPEVRVLGCVANQDHGEQGVGLFDGEAGPERAVSASRVRC
jgi:hypothetical protein